MSTLTHEQPRVLYLTHRVPYPPDKGDRIRNYYVLRELARHAKIWLGCLADEPVTVQTRTQLESLCERVAVIPVNRMTCLFHAGLSLIKGRSLSEGAFSNHELQRVIRSWVSQVRFHAGVVSASSIAAYLRDRGLETTPAYVDLVDVDSQKWLDFANATRPPRSWLYRLEASRIRKLERNLTRWTNAMAVVSRAEADVLDHDCGPGTATVASNGVDLDYFQPVPTIENGILSCAFVGALDYLPNVDAAVWFARNIWPRIRTQFPTAEFRVIGRQPTVAVQELATLPGVCIIGQIPDVRPYVADATIVVVPLRLARGIQNKVLEALAMAKPVVASPPSLAALATQSGKHLLSATSIDDWVQAVSQLFLDQSQRRILGEAGRRYVEQHHNWDSCLEPFITQIFPPQQPR